MSEPDETDTDEEFQFDGADDDTAPLERGAESVEATATRAGEAVAETIGAAMGWLWFFTGGMVRRLGYGITRFLPWFGTKWWKAMTVYSLNAYFKNKSGSPDALGFVTEKDSQDIDLRPARVEHNIDEIDEESGWNVSGEDRYWKRSQHPELFRIGKVPVVWFDRDSTRAGSPLEANVTEAIDDGRMRRLYDVSDATLRAEIDYGDDVPAVADGGQAKVSREFDPRESPVFKDMVLDMGAGEGFVGRALSFTSYKDHANADTDPEELVKAEERGRLAGLAGMDKGAFVLKVFLIAAALVAVIYLGPMMLSGSGGGGGGGIAPFALGVWGLI